MKLLRSLVFVPGNRANMLERALGFGADVVMVDLEDSVPPGEKVAARELAVEWVPRLRAAGRRVMVRVNSLDTGLTADELAAVVSPDLSGISIGKGDTQWDLQQVDRLLAPLEASAGIEAGTLRVVPWIETAMAIVHVYEMARASQRIAGIAFGAEDYTNDMGVIRNDFGEECYYARSAVAVAAKAAGSRRAGRSLCRDSATRTACALTPATRGRWATPANSPSTRRRLTSSTKPSRRTPTTWPTPGRWWKPGTRRKRPGAVPFPSTGAWWTCPW